MDTELTPLFQALTDPTRRAVLQHLGERPHRAGELAQAVGMSTAAMSRHLRVLLDAQLVSDERGASDARMRVFTLRIEGLLPARSFLDGLQAHWQEQLQSFQRHVEGRDQ